MEQPAPTTPFHIVTNGAGGRVEVDGIDVTDRVDGVELVIGFDAPTNLVLHRKAGAGTIEGEAVVTVASPADVAAAVRTIDPAALRAAVLARNPDMGTDTYALTLDVIADMVTP